jgi:hypothetical protein
MTETLDPVVDEVDQDQLAEQLLAQAKEQGIELMGPNGLLNQLAKNVLETALDRKMERRRRTKTTATKLIVTSRSATADPSAARVCQ